jgi:ABC-type multidrug transport system ATPase subunit
MGRLEGLSEQETKEKSEELYQEFYMESMLDTPIKHLSKGTLQKVAVIQALLSKPDILLMDEPLSGQDMQSQQNFIRRIKELKQEGVSILMSCHEKFLVNQLSDTAYRIVKGKLVAEKIEDTRYSEYDLLTFQKGRPSESVPQNLHSLLVRVEEKDDSIKIVVQKDRSNRIVKDMLAEGFILKEMRGMSE